MNEFVELVKRMREAQKTYFRTRTSDSLEASKSLERDVDIEVKRLLDPQQELFK